MKKCGTQDKFGHGFDAIGFDVTPFDACSDNVIGKLMDLLRTEILVGRHHVKYNQMWFKLLFTAILQNVQQMTLHLKQLMQVQE